MVSLPNFFRKAALASFIAVTPANLAYAACIDAFMSGFDEYEAGQPRAKQKFAIEELLVICFQAKESGFVAVYDAPALGDYEQLYPNGLTHPGGDTHTPIEANKRYCLGGRDTFPMFHPRSEGIGQGKVSIMLTKSTEHQLQPDDFAIPGQRVGKQTMELHLSNHSKSSGNCTPREVSYINYRVTN
ncbi:MAG: hypothetical protein AAF423_11755 [Pseudomonadota bacterium]